MRKKNKTAPRQEHEASVGEFYRENKKNPRDAELLKRLNSKIWQARNLATDAKIRIENKDLRLGPYHEGWTRISAQDALGENWGKVKINAEAEEMFQMFGISEQ